MRQLYREVVAVWAPEDAASGGLAADAGKIVDAPVKVSDGLHVEGGPLWASEGIATGGQGGGGGDLSRHTVAGESDSGPSVASDPNTTPGTDYNG